MVYQTFNNDKITICIVNTKKPNDDLTFIKLFATNIKRQIKTINEKLSGISSSDAKF